MPTNRVIYNNQLLLVGPAPASGYYFCDPNGTLLPTGVHNLIQPLKRINQFSYQISTQPARFTEIGNASTIYDHNLNPPEINLSFNYNIKDLRNEARLGFYVDLGPPNLDQFDGGQTYPSGNILSGFAFGDQGFAYNTDLTIPTNNTFKYPFKYRDQRNLFLSINPNPADVINSNLSGFPVLAFGNCFITSYGVNAKINEIPIASVTCTAHNVLYYSSGTNAVSPFVEPKSGLLNTGVRFSIPNYNTAYEEIGNSISVLLPGEITVDVFDVNSTSKTKSNVIIQDSAIQGFNFTIPLDRESLKTLGYVYPVDRQINTPITVEGTFSAIYKNLIYSGDLISNIKSESKYDIVIKMNKDSDTIIRYDIRGAKFKDLSYDSSVGANAVLDFSFYCDMDQNSYPHPNGLSMSGLLKGLSYTNFNTNGPL
jgi:hypothetical protein